MKSLPSISLQDTRQSWKSQRGKSWREGNFLVKSLPSFSLQDTRQSWKSELNSYFVTVSLPSPVTTTLGKDKIQLRPFRPRTKVDTWQACSPSAYVAECLAGVCRCFFCLPSALRKHTQQTLYMPSALVMPSVFWAISAHMDVCRVLRVLALGEEHIGRQSSFF